MKDMKLNGLWDKMKHEFTKCRLNQTVLLFL